MTKVYCADLFAGAGGTSTGLIQAAKELGLEIDLVAVNHWTTAINTHAANYPWARHFQADVEAVNPLEAVPGRHLHLLVASPECTHHSNAAGGRPKNEQKRSSPWAIFRWLEFLNVDAVLVENVRELQSWGPLDKDGYPIEALKGTIYRRWLSVFRAYGYTVETRELNAADYGAPTSRNRLFIVGMKGKIRPVWPVPTHCRQGWPRHKWRAAREIIDWSLKGESIFNRKKPLSPKTIQRIIEGLKRFGGSELRPFIVLMEHGGAIRDVDSPLPTITTAKGGAFGVVQPEPFLVAMEQVNREGPKTKSVDNPLWTVTAKGAIGFAEPFLVATDNANRNDAGVRSIADPVYTLTSHGAVGVAEPFLTPNFGEDVGQAPRVHSIDNPLPAVTSKGAGNLVEAYLVQYNGNSDVSSIDESVPTIPTKDRFGIVEPYLLRFNGTQDAQIKSSAVSVEKPVPVIATQTHFGLVQPVINGCALDIKFRMLTDRELAAATGFSQDYQFRGTKTEVVKQIGNAVVVPMAKALCLPLLRKVTAIHDGVGVSERAHPRMGLNCCNDETPSRNMEVTA